MEVTRNHSWNGFQFDQAASAIRQQAHSRTSSAPSSINYQTSGLGATTMPSSSSEWVQCYDENTGYSFFQNTRTGESQWIEPEHWAQEEQSWKEDMQDNTNTGTSDNGESKVNSDIPESDKKETTVGRKTSNVVTEMRTAVQVRYVMVCLFRFNLFSPCMFGLVSAFCIACCPSSSLLTGSVFGSAILMHVNM